MRAVPAGSAHVGAVQSRRAVALGDSADAASGIEFVRESAAADFRRGREFEPRQRSDAVDRALNLALASIATLLVAPVLLLVALGVKLTSPGPVMYTQTRVGRDRRRLGAAAGSDRRRSNSGGALFTILKFRSMRTNAESGGTAVWAVQNDPRVTPIGNFLRRSRLDELPQLLNVIRGDMNIVGPRPERPQIFNELAGQIPEYSLRALAKPGITGLAQINHTYDTCIDSVRIKVRYDLEYLESASIWTDLGIMLMTLPVMLLRRGGW